MASQQIAQLLLEQLDSDRNSFWWDRTVSTNINLSLDEILRKTKNYYFESGHNTLPDRMTCLFLREAIELISEDGIEDPTVVFGNDISAPIVLDWLNLNISRVDFVNMAAENNSWREDKKFDTWAYLREGYAYERNNIYRLVADYLQSLEDSGFSVADYLPPSEESDSV